MPHALPIASWQDTACSKCPGLASCRTQVVVASPCQPGGLLAVGEAPGGDEDRVGEGFVGAAGKTLDRLFSGVGLARADYGRANICRCRPPENRKPTSGEARACMPFLANLIVELRPRVVLAVGGTPTNALTGPGTLYSKLEARLSSGNWGAKQGAAQAHPGLREALNVVEFVVPMPHTSPLAFNRNSPTGEKWARIAERQVALAAALLKD